MNGIKQKNTQLKAMPIDQDGTAVANLKPRTYPQKDEYGV